MLLAARALAGQNETMQLTVNGMSHGGPFTVRRSGIDLMDAPVTVRNDGAEPVTAVVTSVAAPIDPLPAGGNGFTIARSYFTLDGRPASLQQVEQNQRLVVVLQIAELNTWPSRIVVTDLLPAGFEIDNPALTGSAQLKNFDWLGNVNPAHLEFLDDRFVAAFDRSAGDIREQPEHWINVLNIDPTIESLQSLSVLIRQKPVIWVCEFLELHGIESLCELLEIKEAKSFLGLF